MTDDRFDRFKALRANQLFPLPPDSPAYRPRVEMDAYDPDAGVDDGLEPMFAALGRALRGHWAWFLLGVVAGLLPAVAAALAYRYLTG